MVVTLRTAFMHPCQKLALLTDFQIRDQQVAAAFGLPARIRDEDCDIPMLEESDFEEEGPVGNPAIFGTPKVEHALYMIQMTRLARLRMNTLPYLEWSLAETIQFEKSCGPRTCLESCGQNKPNETDFDSVLCNGRQNYRRN